MRSGVTSQSSVRFLISILTTTFFLSQSAEAWPHKKPPVCIIGAGPAGLTAANRLEEKGYKAVIFEKQPEVGGKCQSYYDELGIFHPLGAAFYSNASYPETLKVINNADIGSVPFGLAGDRQQFRYNYTNGDITPVPALSVQFVLQIQVEIPRYAKLWTQKFAPYSAPNYKNGVPDELTVSGTEWFAKNNFTALPILLVNPLALYGYGDIRVVPILYILQYMTPDILTGFIGQHDVYYTDFHLAWKNWSRKFIKSPIHTSSEIRCIDRASDTPTIKYTSPHGNFYQWKQQKCSHIIFAFPPSITNLERAGLDLTEEENNLFKEVVVHNYFSSAVNFSLPTGVSYIAASNNPRNPPPNDGEPVAVLRLSPTSDISTSWSWGKDNEYESEPRTRDLLQASLSKINKDPRNVTAQSMPLDGADIRAFRKWDYFPHFGSDALRGCDAGDPKGDGAYARLNRLQGKKKTFWASGLAGMEIVEWAIRGGQDVVDTHF
ncbi:FAD/NAD(P)-binding domain-containing protein [Amniculicola lignicola CBS 123094]|uniref:FAD/NAD(P)-binding domain-containing protein n=1 Tax=Amniculicola lignicola CBS 123094 TaxID=1392246 RepID=A0A6A5W3W0_9PLEO|nr:FAD/NAD(P)-binding domain-containing protein [Amniculicola lignicola CBS 123094]